MKPFALLRPASTAAAVGALAEGGSIALKGSVALKAGGVDLLDRMKERVSEPDKVVSLVDVGGLGGRSNTAQGGLRLGALATLQQIADCPEVLRLAPTLAKAAGLAASPQLRRRATLGGNLGQHTRCGYYRHATFACVKRGADACPVRAETGVQDTAGIFGNDLCASAHPSSVAPVLGALGAVVHVEGPKGARQVAFADLWAAPARGRASDLALDPAEVIVAVELPPAPGPVADGYEEVRVKAAFDWALVSCAVRIHGLGSGGGAGAATGASIWLGSVAPTPYRAAAAEALVKGPMNEALAEKVGAAAAQGATPLAGTAYKVQLVKVVVRRALLAAAGRS
jgi:xanthine dehydrogenase YagS FAD-binding subunit